MPRIALFHREYLRYHGGHGKVWDYFRHFIRSGIYAPRVYFTPDSIIDETNPWRSVPELIIPAWEPASADLLFLEGLDWTDMPPETPPGVPIINLIQHVRHAIPSQPRYKYLQNKAIRICVSRAVAEAIRATGKVNGPILTIPNGVDLPGQEMPRVVPAGEARIVIGALKNPALGSQLGNRLREQGFEVDVLMDLLPRAEYLRRLATAGIAVLLPNRTEGFYLPGLEAMALGTPVIMPDCVGNMEYARHGENCLIADAEGIPVAIRLLRSGDVAARLAASALETAKAYTLELEYERVLEVLRNVEALWRGS